MGGLNLYGFVGNDGVGKWDFLGLLFGCDDCDGQPKGSKKAAISNERITVQGTTVEEFKDFWLTAGILDAILQSLGNVATSEEDVFRQVVTGGVSSDVGNGAVGRTRIAWDIRKAAEESFGKEVTVDYQCYECGSCWILCKSWNKNGNLSHASSSSSKKTDDPIEYAKLKRQAIDKANKACNK